MKLVYATMRLMRATMKPIGAAMLALLAPPMWASEGYPTLDAAAYAALAEARTFTPAYFEWAGILWEGHDGLFYYSEPQTSRRTHNFEIRAGKPRGTRLAGIYHTHPEGGQAHVFSNGDLDVAKRMRVPSYIGIPDGTVRVYVHGKHRRIHGTIAGARTYDDSTYSRGEEVLP